jgi:hypothetical protein
MAIDATGTVQQHAREHAAQLQPALA